MTEGPAIPATVESHPDPFAEAVRWDATEGELVQAIGRLRGPRRNSLCFLDILSDVVLPITADEVIEWDAVCPKAEADMMVEGVVLMNVEDAKKAYRMKEHQARGVGGFLNRLHIKETTDSSPVRKFTSKKAGPGQKVYEGYLLPAILPERELQTWLEKRLDSSVSLEVERRNIWMGGVVEREPAGMPLGELMGVIGGWLGESAECDDHEQESEATPGTT
jgi:hypothetical protein